MAIRGELVGGEVSFSKNGATQMVAKLDLIDDVLGQVGFKLVPMSDPAIVAQVRGFIEAMLPGMTAQSGIAITLPVAPDPVAPVEPPGEGDGGGGQ